jgi:ABC-type multidrug transport system ATPase subunit
VSAALELNGVVKCYGKLRALDGLDLSVPRGSIFGLVGSNGAGKTTAMAVATGLLASAEGNVNLFGEGPFNAEKHAGRITLLPQDSRFSPHSRVEDVLRFYAQLQNIPADTIERNITELLDWVHLQERRRSAVRTLSHGMSRRLSIAQAFLGSPELVLLDEPLNGLDPREAARVRDLIRERRGRQAIVISSHQLTDIEVLCDHVAFIEKGRLVRQDTLEKITQRSHRITYTFNGGVFPLPALNAALPDVKWELAGNRATATFPAQQTTEQINAAVLPVLLAAGVGVLEIQRGSDLESEYLTACLETPL